MAIEKGKHRPGAGIKHIELPQEKLTARTGTIKYRPWQPRTGGTPGSAGFRWDSSRNGWIGPGGNFVPAGTNAWLRQFEPAFAGKKKLLKPVPPRSGGTPRRLRKPRKPVAPKRPARRPPTARRRMSVAPTKPWPDNEPAPRQRVLKVPTTKPLYDPLTFQHGLGYRPPLQKRPTQEMSDAYRRAHPGGGFVSATQVWDWYHKVNQKRQYKQRPRRPIGKLRRGPRGGSFFIRKGRKVYTK